MSISVNFNMPQGDFNGAGFAPLSFDSGAFSQGLLGCKRTMNGNHDAGNFEVLNMAPTTKRRKMVSPSSLKQESPMFNEYPSSCAPPVYGHYGFIPNLQEVQPTPRAQALAEDAPLSSAAIQEELLSMQENAGDCIDEDMDTSETVCKNATDDFCQVIPAGSSNGLCKIEDPRALEQQSRERLLKPYSYYNVFH